MKLSGPCARPSGLSSLYSKLQKAPKWEFCPVCGKIAQWTECLLHKHKDLSLIPCISAGSWAQLCVPVTPELLK